MTDDQQGRLARIWAWVWHREWWVLGAMVVVGVQLVVPVFLISASTKPQRYASLSAVPSRTVGIVFGAGVTPDGTPTPYLQRRLDTAVRLYKTGKIQTVLLSGDNSTSHYNEPEAMKRYIIAEGVSPEAVVLDYAGFNTYDTCYRARAIFGLHEAMLITHGYHLPRAIWTCDGLGVHSVGVAAQDTSASGGFTVNYLIREVVSTDKAVFQNVFKPHPTVLGNPEPIIKN